MGGAGPCARFRPLQGTHTSAHTRHTCRYITELRAGPQGSAAAGTDPAVDSGSDGEGGGAGPTQGAGAEGVQGEGAVCAGLAELGPMCEVFSRSGDLPHEQGGEAPAAAGMGRQKARKAANRQARRAVHAINANNG